MEAGLVVWLNRYQMDVLLFNNVIFDKSIFHIFFLIILIKLEFRIVLSFCGGRKKPENHKKKPLKQALDKNQQRSQSPVMEGLGFKPGTHGWEGSALTSALNLPPFNWRQGGGIQTKKCSREEHLFFW